MSNTARIAATAANTLTKPLNVEEVFSTYLYDGNGSTQTITNGVDLSGEGGMTWIKRRNLADSHLLTDSERGYGQILQSDTTGANQNLQSLFNLSTTSSGFTIGSANTLINASGSTYASWTFRKAPKFFDVVTYTGNGTSQTISHNLGAEVGCIMVKATSIPSNWAVWHNSFSVPTTNYLRLNSTNAVASDANYWNSTAPTSSAFSVGASATTNSSGATYVAYLFAHNDGDGEFGPDGDQDIIKCGSFTGNGSTTGPEIDLGFEPQWLLVKRAVGGTEYWQIVDNMRGVATGGNDSILYPNANVAEVSTDVVEFNATGFQPKTTSGSWNASGNTYIYIAIRRGPMAVPEDADDVFDISYATDANDASFPVDLMLTKIMAGGNGYARDRLRGGTKYLLTDTTNADLTGTDIEFDDMTGTGLTGWGTGFIHYNWKRAPNYFDVVAGTGTSTLDAVSHNLGVTPELIIQKKRSGSSSMDWFVTGSGVGGTNKYLILNSTAAVATTVTLAHDASTFTPIFDQDNYIAYLFASLPGVSKVGSYTGDGTTGRVIDCGFSSGARFVLIKPTSQTGGWSVYDTERGIVAGSDPVLYLNSTTAESSPEDDIDPHNSGFILNHKALGNFLNGSGVDYIFYAIA